MTALYQMCIETHKCKVLKYVKYISLCTYLMYSAVQLDMKKQINLKVYDHVCSGSVQFKSKKHQLEQWKRLVQMWTNFNVQLTETQLKKACMEKTCILLVLGAMLPQLQWENTWISSNSYRKVENACSLFINNDLILQPKAPSKFKCIYILQPNVVKLSTIQSCCHIIWIKYDLRQKYYAPQVRPDRGSNFQVMTVGLHFMSLRHLL